MLAGCADLTDQTREECRGLDLALLASCHHTITSHGLYSFWASFLAGSGSGLRIVPQFSPQYRLASQYSHLLRKHPFKTNLPRFYSGLQGIHWLTCCWFWLRIILICLIITVTLWLGQSQCGVWSSTTSCHHVNKQYKSDKWYWNTFVKNLQPVKILIGGFHNITW